MVSEKSTLVIIQEKINELDDKITNLFKIFGIEPMPDSIAAKEMASEYAETVLSAHSHGTRLIEVASDNLSAFAREIIEPVLPFALYTTIRSVLETASICIWLLDEDINLNERISRSYAFRCRGLEQQKIWAVATKNQDIIKHAEKRYIVAMQQAKKMGITKKNKKGEDALINKMPSFTDMVSDQIHQEVVYRLLSAMTHANHWALIGLGYVSVVDIPNGKLQKKVVNAELINNLAIIGIIAFQKQIICKCKLFGWPTEEINAAFADTKNTLILNLKS